MLTRTKHLKEPIRRFTIGSFYDLWYKKERKKASLSRQRYILVAKLLLKEINKFLVANPQEFRLPKRMGTMQVMRTKYNTDNIDFQATKRVGRIVRNHHLRKIPTYIFSWKKTKADFTNKEFYKFKICQGKPEEYWGRRGLTQFIRDTLNDPFKPDFERL
jgi:hypothetical protein